MKHQVVTAAVMGFAAVAPGCLAALTVIGGPATVASQWFGSAGAYTTIDFTGHPNGTRITEQYASLGVHFGLATPLIWLKIQGPYPDTYPQDGWGINTGGASGNYPTVDVEFDEPMRGFAMFAHHCPEAKFYLGTQIVHDWAPMNGQAPFTGYFSDEPFDRVVVRSINTGPYNPILVKLDNIYFTTVPSPSVAVALGIAAIIGRKRRRK